MKLTPFIILSLTILFNSENSFAQDKSLLKGDTIFYDGSKFYKGQVLTLGYGSAADKSFAFVWTGSGFAVGGNAPAGYGKSEIEIVKFQKGGGKNFLKAKLIGISGSALTIDLEGALDNGELKTPK